MVAAAASVTITDPANDTHLPASGEMGYKVTATYSGCGPQEVYFMGGNGGGMFTLLDESHIFTATDNLAEYWASLDLVPNSSYSNYHVRPQPSVTPG